MAIDTLGSSGRGTEVDQTSLVTDEEGGAVSPAEDLAIGGAIAVVVGADSVLFRVAVGTLGDGAEEEVLRSGSVGDADGECAGGVTVDAVGAAAGLAGDGVGGRWAGVRGCKANDGGEPEEERVLMHCGDEGDVWGLCMR